MPRTITTSTISYETAALAVAVAIETAARSGVRAVVTVADPALGLVAFGRADGATPHSVETSTRKARTAASTRRATGWMRGELATSLPLGTGMMLTNVQGGYPIAFDGVHVGGIGVAGGVPAEDAAIAVAVLEAIGADAVLVHG